MVNPTLIESLRASKARDSRMLARDLPRAGTLAAGQSRPKQTEAQKIRDRAERVHCPWAASV